MPFITLSNVYLFSNGTCNAPSHSAASTTNGKGGGKAKSDSSGCLISCSEPRTCGQGPGERYGHAACLVKFGRVEKQKRVMFVMGGIDPLSRTTFRDAYQLDLSSLNDAELSHHPLTWSRIQMQPSPRLLPALAFHTVSSISASGIAAGGVLLLWGAGKDGKVARASVCNKNKAPPNTESTKAKDPGGSGGTGGGSVILVLHPATRLPGRPPTLSAVPSILLKHPHTLSQAPSAPSSQWTPASRRSVGSENSIADRARSRPAQTTATLSNTQQHSATATLHGALQVRTRPADSQTRRSHVGCLRGRLERTSRDWASQISSAGSVVATSSLSHNTRDTLGDTPHCNLAYLITTRAARCSLQRIILTSHAPRIETSTATAAVNRVTNTVALILRTESF